jgi:hypothetical protein
LQTGPGSAPTVRRDEAAAERTRERKQAINGYFPIIVNVKINVTYTVLPY